MKLVMFRRGEDVLPGILTERGVVSAEAVVEMHQQPTLTMVGLIDQFDALRPGLDRLAEEGAALPLDAVDLCAPLVRPGKVLCCAGNYWEHAQRGPRAAATCS